MTRIFAAFATLLLLSGCATYGDGYYRDRAVYADGAYYYPAYEGEGDYYYGADDGYDYDYYFSQPYAYTPVWGLARYRCRGYYGCVPAWGGYYPYHYVPGWHVSFGYGWNWGSWGWYGGRDWHRHHYGYRHRGDRDRDDRHRDDRHYVRDDDGRREGRDRYDARPRSDYQRLQREDRRPAGVRDGRALTELEQERRLRRPALGDSGRPPPDPIPEDAAPQRIDPESAQRMPASGLRRPAPATLDRRMGRPLPRETEQRQGGPTAPEARYRVREPMPSPREQPRPLPRQAPAPRYQEPRPAPRQAPAQRYEPRPAPRQAPAATPRPAPRPAPQVRPASQNRTSDSED